MSYESKSRIRGSIAGLNSEDGRNAKRYEDRPDSPPVLSGGFDHAPDPKEWVAAPRMPKLFVIDARTINRILENRGVLATMGTFNNRENVWYINIDDFMEKYHWIKVR